MMAFSCAAMDFLSLATPVIWCIKRSTMGVWDFSSVIRFKYISMKIWLESVKSREERCRKQKL